MNVHGGGIPIIHSSTRSVNDSELASARFQFSLFIYRLCSCYVNKLSLIPSLVKVRGQVAVSIVQYCIDAARAERATFPVGNSNRTPCLSRDRLGIPSSGTFGRFALHCGLTFDSIPQSGIILFKESQANEHRVVAAILYLMLNDDLPAVAVPLRA